MSRLRPSHCHSEPARWSMYRLLFWFPISGRRAARFSANDIRHTKYLVLIILYKPLSLITSLKSAHCLGILSYPAIWSKNFLYIVFFDTHHKSGRIPLRLRWSVQATRECWNIQLNALRRYPVRNSLHLQRNGVKLFTSRWASQRNCWSQCPSICWRWAACDPHLIWLIFVDFGIDPTWTTLIGGDWNLNIEYCNAVLCATILEGELYILSIAKGGKREIASWAAWFPPGNALFGTQVPRTSYPTHPPKLKSYLTVKLNGL